MNKTDVIRKVAEKTNQPQALAANVIDELLELITAEVKKGKEVSIGGFGKFYCHDKPERMVRNPRTGGQIAVEASRKAKFKPFKGFMGHY